MQAPFPEQFAIANYALAAAGARACFAFEHEESPEVKRIQITVEEHDGLTVVHYEWQGASGFPLGGMTL